MTQRTMNRRTFLSHTAVAAAATTLPGFARAAESPLSGQRIDRIEDLAGIILDKPVWAMTGAKKPHLTKVYSGMIYFDDLDPADKPAGIDKVLENCRWDYDYGYRQLKVKIGRGNKWMSASAGLQRDIDVVKAIHKAGRVCGHPGGSVRITEIGDRRFERLLALLFGTLGKLNTWSPTPSPISSSKRARRPSLISHCVPDRAAQLR